jgi:anti-sigma factor RsiW
MLRVEVEDRSSPRPGDVDCPDAERLAEYVDGGLPPWGRDEIEAHLVDCSDCRAIVAETTEFVRADAVGEKRWQQASAPMVKFSRRCVAGVTSRLAAARVFFTRPTRP